MILKVYLAGSIEGAKDEGKTWRKELSVWLENNQYEVFDPTDYDYEILKKYNVKTFNDIGRDKLPEVMRDIVSRDLDQVLESDIIIVKYDKDIQKGAGTQGEITVGACYGTPVYIWLDNIKEEELPRWIIGCATKIFSNLNELKRYLRQRNHTNSINITKEDKLC